MVKTAKKDTDVKDAKHENGGAEPTASPTGDTGAKESSHRRSSTLDNAFLLQAGRSLDHSDVEDRHSLPSLEHLDDETPAFAEEGLPAELLEVLANPSIEDDSPAAEALRANAEVRVRKVGKLARRVHGQSVRRVVKRATLRAKSGNVRGKPPRIPPGKVPTDSVPAGPDNEIYVVHEGDESEELGEDEMDSSIESSEQEAEYKHDHDEEAMFAAASGERTQSEDDEVVTEEEADPLVDKVPDGVHDWQTRLIEGEDIPVEVLTATMETGKKGEHLHISQHCRLAQHCSNPFNLCSVNDSLGARGPS